MPSFHNATIRVFVYPEDDADTIANALRWLVPIDLAKEKMAVEKKTAAGFNERTINILTIKLDKQRHVKQFTQWMREQLGAQCMQVVDQIESRLDETMHFFLRFDKKSVVDKSFKLTDSGDCFHVTLTVAAFPAKREPAIKVLKDFFAEEK